VVVERFGGGAPAEGLAGSGVEGVGIAAMSSALQRARSVPFGKYWRKRPLVFSLVPRCHGLFGSAKYTLTPEAIENCA
jgi:hypothetical protein